MRKFVILFGLVVGSVALASEFWVGKIQATNSASKNNATTTVGFPDAGTSAFELSPGRQYTVQCTEDAYVNDSCLASTCSAAALSDAGYNYSVKLDQDQNFKTTLAPNVKWIAAMCKTASTCECAVKILHP